MRTLENINAEWWQVKLNNIGEVVEDYEDIAQCLQIILTTPKGQDPHRPEFGSDIWKYIDYPVSEAIPNIIKEAINAITLWEPRVDIKSIKAEVDGSNVILKIDWSIKDTGEINRTEITL